MKMDNVKKEVEVDLLVMATAALQEEIEKDLAQEDPKQKGVKDGNNSRDDGND